MTGGVTGLLDRLTWRVGFIAAAALAVLLGIGVTTQTIRIEGINLWPLRIEGFKAANARLTLDLDRVKEATELADAKARAAKVAAEAEYQRKAEETDAKYQVQLADMRGRAARYADAHRVRPQAVAGARGRAAAPAEGQRAEGADRSGSDAELVAVTRADFDTLTENTLRLQQAHEWACGLVGEGCAAESGEPGGG